MTNDSSMPENFNISNGGGVKRFLLDLVYPNRCPFCSEFLPYDRLCCEDCFNEVLWTDELICPVCGKPKAGDCICPVSYSRCITAVYYKGAAKTAVLNYKYRSHTDAAILFGRVLHDKLMMTEYARKTDLALPVPLSPPQLRQRGYDQAELLAREITKGTDIPVANMLRRKKPRTEQHELSASERRAASAEQYSFAGGDLSEKTILLVDDVLTTGATLDVCSEILLRNGAEEVICAVIATVL